MVLDERRLNLNKCEVLSSETDEIKNAVIYYFYFDLKLLVNLFSFQDETNNLYYVVLAAGTTMI